MKVLCSNCCGELPELDAALARVKVLEEDRESLRLDCERLIASNDSLVDTISALRWRMGPRGDMREVAVAMPDPNTPDRYLIVRGLPEGLEAFKNFNYKPKG